MSTPDPVLSSTNAQPDAAPSSGTIGETDPPRARQGGNQQSPNNINPTNTANFEGDRPTLTEVLGLRVEGLTKKLPFHQFVEKVYYHAVTTYKDGGDLHPLFFELKN